jgi:hypothetical protein
LPKLQDFAKELFRLWDQKQFGKIPLRVLIQNFIALGLSATEDEALDVRESLFILTCSFSNM